MYSALRLKICELSSIGADGGTLQLNISQAFSRKYQKSNQVKRARDR